MYMCTYVYLLDIGIAGSVGAELVTELQDISSITFIEKKQYSAFFNSTLHQKLKEISAAHNNNKPIHLYITGINTDYCIFLTAIDAFYLGYRFTVVDDAVGSTLGKVAHFRGLDMFSDFFINGNVSWYQQQPTEQCVNQLKQQQQ
eukprot:GHVS01023584.1.p1 GENE.GHVS01023584.1~~GHVS01023584.1.p1  ORF type:complete len:145 (+),score=17.76 GHVS01023584.1:455-889(+)